MTKMYDYIKREQVALLNILNSRDELYSNMTGAYLSDEWHIFATGSSYNAALTTKKFLEKECGIRVIFHNNYDFLYYSNEKIESGIAIGISQSGSSTSTIRALKQVTVPSLGLTSKNESQLSLAVDEIINLGIGIESVGYVTLGYSAIILNLVLMGLLTSLKLRRISYEDYSKWIDRIEKELLKIEDTINISESFIEDNMKMISSVDHYVSIGSGNSYLLSKELDTKFIETIRKPVNIRELDEFMHGQYLQLNDKQLVIFLETGIRKIDEEMRELKSYVERYNNNTITIGYSDVDDSKHLKINSNYTELSMLLLIIPIQLMAYKISEYNNSDYMSGKFKDFGSFMNSKNKEEVKK